MCRWDGRRSLESNMVLVNVSFSLILPDAHSGLIPADDLSQIVKMQSRRKTPSSIDRLRFGSVQVCSLRRNPAVPKTEYRNPCVSPESPRFNSKRPYNYCISRETLLVIQALNHGARWLNRTAIKQNYMRIIFLLKWVCGLGRAVLQWGCSREARLSGSLSYCF